MSADFDKQESKRPPPAGAGRDQRREETTDASRDGFDRALEAALREHSPELPSPAVDAAILAAAHAAAASATHEDRVTQSAQPIDPVLSSPRPWKVWMPFAAAAVVAVVALGVVPLAPTLHDNSKPVLDDEAREAPKITSARIQDRAPRSNAAAGAASDPGGRVQRPRMDSMRPADTARAPNTPAFAAPPPTAPQSPSNDVTANRAPTQSTLKEQAAGAAALRKDASAEHAGDAEQRITRIRTLRDAGNAPEARRELIRFRETYADADARLPDDLRAWAKSVR